MDNIYHVSIELHLNYSRFDDIDVQSFDSYEKASKAFDALVKTVRNQPNNPWFYHGKALKSHCVLATSRGTKCLSRFWHVCNERTGQYCRINLTEYKSKNSKNVEYCKELLDAILSNS